MTDNGTTDLSTAHHDVERSHYKKYDECFRPEFEDDSSNKSVQTESKVLTVNPEAAPEHLSVFLDIGIILQKQKIEELNRKLNPFSD